jgi:hypothetical protein
MKKLHVSLLTATISMLGLGFGFAVQTGCGSSGDVAIPSPACSGDCVCTGDTCECKAGGKCAFGGSATGAAGAAGATGADGGEAGDGDGGTDATPPPEKGSYK